MAAVVISVTSSDSLDLNDDDEGLVLVTVWLGLGDKSRGRSGLILFLLLGEILWMTTGSSVGVAGGAENLDCCLNLNGDLVFGADVVALNSFAGFSSAIFSVTSFLSSFSTTT